MIIQQSIDTAVNTVFDELCQKLSAEEKSRIIRRYDKEYADKANLKGRWFQGSDGQVHVATHKNNQVKS